MTDSPRAASADRIAIIGIGCRFPGHARDHRAFWQNLIDGRDCLTPTPSDRYDFTTLGSRDRAKPGRMTGGRGGYIDGFDEFDPAFFGISPREAGHMDPQQRKLLEVAWEALEDGGQRPGDLAGHEVGVFIGAFTLDYKILQFADLGFQSLAAHTATGTMMTMVANRISHCFDFRGPSVSIDTACSSSLVAVHLARQSLLRGESDLALAGGTLLHMAPQYTIAETKGGFLSATGQSRAFDASADGYVRAEGVGVVVLKRLADAVRDGDPIHAVVAGTGVNQDGRTNGITVPNPDAQATLIERVCAEAGVTPGEPAVRGGARHLDTGRRPDRGGDARPGAVHRTQPRRPLLRRLGQDQHRAHRIRRGHRRTDQDRAQPRTPPHPAAPGPRTPQPRHRPVRAAIRDPDPRGGLARTRRAGQGGRQLLRIRRDERARPAGGGAVTRSGTAARPNRPCTPSCP